MDVAVLRWRVSDVFADGWSDRLSSTVAFRRSQYFSSILGYLLKTCYVSLHITRWPNVDICSVVWCHNVELRFASDLVYRYWNLHVLADDWLSRL